MKRITIIVFCLVLWSVAKADEERLDGYRWSEGSLSYKLGLVRGMCLGVNTGANWIEFEQIKGKIYKNNTEAVKGKEEAEMKAKRFKEEKGFDLEGITYGQIISTIDEVYLDERVKNWSVIEVMPLVQGRLKKGWTKQDLDEVVAYKIRVNYLWDRLHSVSKLEEYNKTLKEYNDFVSKPPIALRVDKVTQTK